MDSMHLDISNIKLYHIFICMDHVIRKTDAENLLPVRSIILRKNADFDLCRYKGDNNKDSIHLACFLNNKIIGAVSLIKNIPTHKNLKNCVQVRGMCVLKEYQGMGVGKKLIEYAEKKCKEVGFDFVWMNARIIALDFYLKLNYFDSGIKYEISNIGLHHFLFKSLK